MSIQPINVIQSSLSKYPLKQKAISFKYINDSVEEYDRVRGQFAPEIEVKKEALTREAHDYILKGEYNKAALIKQKLLNICVEQKKWEDVKKLQKGISELETLAYEKFLSSIKK